MDEVDWADYKPFETHERRCGNCMNFLQVSSRCAEKDRPVKASGLCPEHRYLGE